MRTNFYCCRCDDDAVCDPVKECVLISTVVDLRGQSSRELVKECVLISTVVDLYKLIGLSLVKECVLISTVVDSWDAAGRDLVKECVLISTVVDHNAVALCNQCQRVRTNFYCCRSNDIKPPLALSKSAY